jgi:hypothetical protein
MYQRVQRIPTFPKKMSSGQGSSVASPNKPQPRLPDTNEVFHPWERPKPILTDAEFQCYNDPVWRVAKLSRMIRQLQTFVHAWKDCADNNREDFHQHSNVLQKLISELATYSTETKTSFSNSENTWHTIS